MGKKRASGILLHITSLPCEYGVGDLGPEAFRFADFLAKAKQRYWQVLPLSPPTLRQNPYSPYNGLSAFAVNTLLISPELLYRQGLLSRKEIHDRPPFARNSVDYRLAIPYKTMLFRSAYERFRRTRSGTDYDRFCSQNRTWLDDFATFVVLRNHFDGRRWCCWPRQIRDRDKHAVQSVKNDLKDDIEREKFLQYVCFKQWFSLKQYCRERAIRIIGDVPIYVAYDSADVWARPEIFKLTETKRPRFVSGVPPDLFSRTGQLWRNPVYDWKVLRRSGYRWWLQRIRHNLHFYDLVRIDHFRGFMAYWELPAGAKTAIKGKWVRGPGADFFRSLFKHVSAARIIAEDLGYITPDVTEVIDRFGLASMRVLLFAFEGDPTTNAHCLHNHVRNSVVYTGTHDNNTLRGWFEKEAKLAQKKRLVDYLGHKVSPANINWQLIRLAMSSVADLVIIPMQDILGLGAEARMNRPATTTGNWRWCLAAGTTKAALARRLSRLTQIYGRA